MQGPHGNDSLVEAIAMAGLAVVWSALLVRGEYRDFRREGRFDWWRLALAALVLLLGVLAFVGDVPLAALYALICLALPLPMVVDVLTDDRKRRRVASLAPRAAVEPVFGLWIGIAAVSSSMALPYLVVRDERVTAVIAGVCTIAVAVLAWRIASAPVQLRGQDIGAEYASDRARRTQGVGITCVLGVGIMFVFMSFSNGRLPIVSPLQRDLQALSFALWAGLWIWEAWRVHRLGGLRNCSTVS